MVNAINYDRGVIFKEHPANGMKIYMYVDKPGEYLTIHGHVIGQSLADEAGFDVARYGRERLKRERMSQAAALIEAELEKNTVEEEVVHEQGGWKVVSIGLGRHKVQDPDGNTITNVYMPKEQAMLLVGQLAPKAEVKEAEADGGKKK
jgi:hypothetical protein